MDRTKAIELLGDVSKVVTKLWYQEGAIEQPIIHFRGKSGEVITSPPSFDKDRMTHAIRCVLELEEAQWVIVICEAWVLEGSGSSKEVEDYLAEHGGTIEEHPDRLEIISYMLEDEDLGTILAEQRIDRVEGGKATLRKLEVRQERGQAEGRFVGMLPRKGSIH